MTSGVDKIFDANVLHEVRFTLNPDDWQALRDNFLSNDFYAAAVSIDGESAGTAGIRSRGAGTRNGIKPAIKVTFDKFVNKQTFHGLKNLNLKNVTADESMLREYLALQVYQAAGIATPAAAMAHLIVNDEDFGVFTMIEQIDKTWLTARFGDNSSDLFSYQWIDKWGFEERGENASYFPEPFEPETNEDSFDPKPLIDLASVANESTDDTLVSDLVPYLDASKFLKFLAVDAGLSEFDGFAGDFGINNFYIYRLPGTTRFELIPWDRDSCLRDADRSLDQGTSDDVLAARLLKRPEFQTQFSTGARDVVLNYVNPSWLGSRLDTAYALIRADALKDTKKPYSNADFEAGVTNLRAVIAARAAKFGWKAS